MMIDALIRWSLAHRGVVWVSALALMVAAAWQLTTLPVDVLPDLSAPTVTVLTEAQGMSPEEVERQITAPMELALQGLGGVRRTRSSSALGLSVVWVEFDWDQESSQARARVAERVQLAQGELPPRLGSPVIAPPSSIMGEIMFVGLTSSTLDQMQLRELAEQQVRRRLMTVPGVSQVVPIGGQVRQLQVRVKPRALQERGLTLEQVIQAVEATHEDVSAGFIVEAGQEWLIQARGRAHGPEEIADALLGVGDQDEPVRVGHVAEVTWGAAPSRGSAGVSGRSGVVLGIQRQPQVNTLALTQQLEHRLDQIEASLPKDVNLERRLLRQSDFIMASVDHVKDALRDGALLVILIVGLFVWSVRATVITALAIPLSLGVTLLVLGQLGITLNTMTLGGMAIAVGALVDDAIIDVENVARRLRERSPQTPVLEVIFMASQEVRGSIVFATLIIMLAFTPLLLLQGVEGRLLRPLGIAYIVSLAASLGVALTVTPALCALLLPGSRAARPGHQPRLVRWLRGRYEALLGRTLHAWPLWMGLSLGATLWASWSLTRVGYTFMPPQREGALTLSVVTLAGTSLEESSLLGQRVEALLLARPEVESTARRTGRAQLDEHAQGTHASEIDARLNVQGRAQDDLVAQLRRSFAQIEGAQITIGQPITHRIDHMLSGSRTSVAIKLFGPELEELERLGQRAHTLLSELPGVVDLALEEQAHLPQLSVRLDRDALARYGLQVRAVMQLLEAAQRGQTVGALYSPEGALIPVVVRYAPQALEDLEGLRRLMVPTPEGGWVPLEALAQIERDHGPEQISRERGQRKRVILCNVAPGYELSQIVEQIQQRLSERLPMPPGYHVDYGGQLQTARQASGQLLGLGALVILGIFGLLVMALGSPCDALLVMINLPLALIGGVAAMHVFDGVLSIASMIGLLTLFGIATRNGIMMISHIKTLGPQQPELSAKQLITRGASERLIAILMTALASALGLLPLALARDQIGAELQAPMAVVILGGLISSTLLNLVVVPSVMLRFGAGTVTKGRA